MELVGNALCLDFANTVDKRPNPDRDELAAPGDLLVWAEAVGIGAGDPGGHVADGEHQGALELREAIYATFSTIAAGGEPERRDLATITDRYGRALDEARWHRQGPRYTLRWPSPVSASGILHRVAASATGLLLEGPLDRVGECPTCCWLFVDTSRNGRRRWCSMATCGSRSKARRYFARHRPR